MAELCELYGWTYQEYMDQPSWFVELVREKYVIDLKRKEKSI